jgi:hypothetical protein
MKLENAFKDTFALAGEQTRDLFNFRLFSHLSCAEPRRLHREKMSGILIHSYFWIENSLTTPKLTRL